MQIKDRKITKIDSIAFGGEGVGRVDHIVVFVPFSAPGDELEIEIIQVKKRFVRGRILKIISESPLRVEPPCRYYQKCGGCCYQHLAYQDQLEIKKKQVEDSFRKIGKIADPPVSDVMASPKTYHYRGKAQFHARAVSGGWEIGFLDVSGGGLVDIERCEIMEETINEKMSALKKHNLLKSSDDAQLTIWSGNLSSTFNEKDSIVRMVKGKKFLVPHDGFFQANLSLTDMLVEEVYRLAACDQVKTLIDAYCGSGLFSVFLSGCAGKVIGIDINEKSIQYARMNAADAGTMNTEFIHGDMEQVFRQKILPCSQADLIVLDPPRTGCEKAVLKAVVDMQPLKIIYISCNPATQARDISYLKEQGYDLKDLKPFDMFPQTEHIEVIGVLDKR